MSVSILKSGIVKGGGTGIGRNLILNSAAYDGNTYWGNWNGNNNAYDRSIEFINGHYWFHFKTNTNGSYGGYNQTSSYYIPESPRPFAPNTKYTISAKWFSTVPISCCYWIHERSSEGGANLNQRTNTFTVNETPTTYYWSFTSGTNATYTIDSFNFMIGVRTANVEADVYLTDIKFEEGEVATPWLPAEEDEMFITSNHAFFEDGSITSIRKDHMLSTEFIEL